MIYNPHDYTAGMSPQEIARFSAEYESTRKHEVVAILLAFFLGSFGAHRFYMGQTGWGILYLCFCWTFVPHIISFIECFFLPGRVRRYNDALAADIAARIRTGYAGPRTMSASLYPA